MSPSELCFLLASVRQRIVRLVRRYGIDLDGALDAGQTTDPLSLESPVLAAMQGASILGRVATGPRAGHWVLRLECDPTARSSPRAARAAPISRGSTCRDCRSNWLVRASRPTRVCRLEGRTIESDIEAPTIEAGRG